MNSKPILIVDDNEFIRASMVKFIEAHGYSVIGTGNAKEAMTILNEKEVLLVITDVLMPDTNGFELVDFIRNSNDLGESMPIIAISGGGRAMDADTVLTSLEEKVDLILKKPFSKKELLDNVSKLSNNKKREANLSK
jgi:two-component system OmpR family response regulator